MLRRHRPAVDGGQPRPSAVRARAACSSTSRAASAPSRRACRCRSATASWPRPPTPWSSVPEIFAYWLQAGRIDVGFLGGAQLDRFANINSTVIGDYDESDDPAPGCRRRTRDRGVGRPGDGDHAPVGAGVRRALRLPLDVGFGDGPGIVRSSACAAAARGRSSPISACCDPIPTRASWC